MAVLVRHHTEVFSFPDDSHGWFCSAKDCTAQHQAISSRENAELEARNHEQCNWGRP